MLTLIFFNYALRIAQRRLYVVAEVFGGWLGQGRMRSAPNGANKTDLVPLSCHHPLPSLASQTRLCSGVVLPLTRNPNEPDALRGPA